MWCENTYIILRMLIVGYFWGFYLNTLYFNYDYQIFYSALFIE